MLLQPTDFPKEWKGFMHPQDLKLKDKGDIKEEIFMFPKRPRLICRFAYPSKKNPEKFIGVT